LHEKVLINPGRHGAPFYFRQKKAAAKAAAEVRRLIKEQ
jgi:hypothetical protein